MNRKRSELTRAHLDTRGAPIGFGLRRSCSAKWKMLAAKYRVLRHRRSTPSGQVLQIATPPDAIHRNVQCVADGAGDAQVINRFLTHPDPIAGSDIYIAGAQVFHFLCPEHSVQPGGFTPAVE